MIASTDNVKDVWKYFGDTYVIIPEISEQHVMLLRNANTGGLVCVDSRDKKEGFISFDGGFEYELIPPLATRKSWFMYEGSAYLISRIPARMWKKGICGENTEICRLAAQGELVACSVTDKLLNAFLQYVPDETLPPARISQVLSSEWAFSGGNNLLYLWETVVGKYSRRTNELFVPQELKNLTLPNTTQKMKVVYV